MVGFVSFMFGWHVHEKAILMILIPFSLISCMSAFQARHFFFLNVVGCYSLFPLLFEQREAPIKIFLLLFHSYFSYLFYHAIFPKRENSTERFHVGWIQSFFILGLFIIELYNLFIHPFFVAHSFPFLNLMIISVFCSIAVSYSFISLYLSFVFQSK